MKFNKDTFLNDITDKVQSAIDKNLITKEDVDNNDLDRLHGFIQYELLEYIDIQFLWSQRKFHRRGIP